MGIDMTNGYPKSLQAWLAASFGLELGLAVLAFAMTWTASAYGPDTASAVLTLTVAPAVVLGLLGGLLADRVGPRRTMIVSSLGLVAISVILAAVAWSSGTSPALLFVIAASMGTVSAFFRPASAVFARLFVADRELGTVMARVGMAGQLARTIGPPLGGFLIGMLTLAGVAWIGAAGAAVMLCVLLLIRVPRRVQPSDVRLGVRGILDAMSAVRSRKDVPALLASVAIIAGAVIPVVALGIPLAARERGWSAGEAGLIEAGWIAGGLVCTAWFGWKGTLQIGFQQRERIIRTCYGQTSTIPLFFKGNGLFSFDYDFVDVNTRKKLLDTVHVEKVDSYSIETPSQLIGKTYEVVLSNAKDRFGCDAVYTDKNAPMKVVSRLDIPEVELSQVEQNVTIVET